MENIVKNIHLLGLEDGQRERLEAGATLYKRFDNLTFKVKQYKDGILIVEARQGKNYKRDYFSEREIVERAKKLFREFSEDFCPDRIHVGIIPFKEVDSDVITVDYLKEELYRLHIRIKDINNDTGLEMSNLSAWINGTRPMSNIVKNMFYYYIRYKELIEQKENEQKND
jgi:hypothetical protein